MKNYFAREKDEYYDFYPFVDDGGNVLQEEDILFVSEKELKGGQQVEIWGDEEVVAVKKGLHCNSPGVKWINEKEGKFPIALKTKNGELLSHKISKKTGRSIPNHAGCTKVIRLMTIGAPASGKSVYTLQLSDPAMHDMLAKRTNLSIEDDLPSDAPFRQKYEEARDNFKKGILPEPNKYNEVITPYYYYVQYGDEKNKEDCILKIDDIDGEACTSIKMDSRILHSNHLNLMVGADDLIRGEKGEKVQYTKVLDQLIPYLRIFRENRNYEVVVTITKADLLNTNNPYLEEAFENSLGYEDGRYTQYMHEAGFNYEAFNKRSRCVEKFLREECPNFYSKLRRVVKKDNLTFCMIASVGEECHGDTYKQYKPFCIDEPILAIMTKAGLYPVAVEDYGHEVNRVPDLSSSELAKEMKKIGGMMKKIVKTLVMKFDSKDEEEWE